MIDSVVKKMIRKNIENNTLEYTYTDENGEAKVEIICGSLEIIKKSKDPELGKKTYTIKYYDMSDGTTQEFHCEPDQLDFPKFSSLLNEHGVEVQSCYYKDLASYLKKEAMNRLIDCQTIKRAGFSDDFNYFYTNEGIHLNGDDKTIDQVGRFSSYLCPNGSKEVYDEMLKKYVADDPKYQLALIFGFAAPISAIQAKNGGDTILVGLTGKTSRGKTVSSQLMISPFANPVFNSNCGFAITAKSTKLAMNLVLGDNWGIPAVIDDISAFYKQNPEDLVYDLASGMCKSSSNQDYTLRETKSWKTLIMLNSEESILNVGAKGGSEVRILKIHNDLFINDKSDEENAKIAEAIRETVIHNYGFYTQQFIKFIGQIGQEEILKGIDEWRAMAYAKLYECHHVDGKSMRVLRKYAVIGYTATLVKQLLKNTIDINIDSINDILINSEYINYEERNIGITMHKIFIEYVTKNKCLFLETDKNKSIPDGYVGQRTETSVIIHENALKKFFKEYNEQKRENLIIESWKFEGFLKTENGHDKVRKTYKGNSIREFYEILV